MADERPLFAIVNGMMDAWNRGSARDFATPFAEHADFIAFDGTHLRGRLNIEQFHHPLFETALKGTRLHGHVKFIRFLDPDLVLMHAVGTTTMAGEAVPLPSRDTMQLFVVTRRDGEWTVDALLQARQLTHDRQRVWDGYEGLPFEGQRQVEMLINALRGSRPEASTGPRSGEPRPGARPSATA